MSGSLQREEELFDAARVLREPVERREFLARNCGSDAALRARIEALLSSENDAERFFADCGAPLSGPGALVPFAPDADAEGDERLGTRIGRYKILEKLGQGGCGTVYLAEQEQPVRRFVALKIIKFGTESKSVIARFEAERQALAMMDHPNIAVVFDAGATDRGPPYFVMELVRGRRITTYCDVGRLPVRRRLELFIQICHAIQHAHQKGVIHGDIKPSNILVTEHDGEPIPKVIDFGVSRAAETGRADLFQASANAQLIGTPAYMSPEQVESGGRDIDTRSDIYCLGVLLYELLAGRPPFDPQALLASGVEAMRRTLRETKPSAPSRCLAALSQEELAETSEARGAKPRQLLSLLQGDLDAIVMKALEKDRRLRYETSNGLALDVQRHLVNEPVAARPASRWYRFQKIVRRNRILFAAGGAVAAALIVGLGSSTWLFIKEREAHRRAQSAEMEQSKLRRKAESREKLALATLLVSQSKYAEADKILGEVVLNEPNVEGAATLRFVGEWLATQYRWKQASERLIQLLEVDQLDGVDTSSLDHLRCGPTLVESGNLEAFGEFCERAVARYAGRSDPFTDRILKIGLLVPCPESRRKALSVFARTSANTFAEAEASSDSFKAAWHTVSLGLWEYRNGNFEKAASWCERGLSYPEHNAARTATTLVILSMAHCRLGMKETARSELSRGQEVIERQFREHLDMGNPVQGFWFDWAFARILMNESRGMLGDGAVGEMTRG